MTVADPTPDLRPDLTTPRAQVLLAIGDDALITGHRASHWTGVAPSLEEDLAFSTIAQDNINHADLWFQVLVGSHGNDDATRRAVDTLGLGRRPDGYRHAIVCERPPGDFAATLARHWVATRVEVARLDALTGSSDTDVAGVATKLKHELRYHDQHAQHWFGKLAGGGDDAHARFGTALTEVLPDALGYFEPVPAEDEAIEAGLLPTGHVALRAQVFELMDGPLTAAGYGGLLPALDAPVPPASSGGRLGHHSDDFVVDVWPEMTALYRAHPDANW
jgi:ring-1,2-phenylacetyl-CoA epoxidase subunit PaaC